MLVLQIIVGAAALVAVARRPRSWSAAALPAAGALLELAVGAASGRALQLAARETVPLALFLTAAIWLARLGEQTGVAERLAVALARGARGRKPLLYVLVCALCAFLTASVSLDGAVVLMAPLVLALARRAPELFRPLLLAVVAVANAFSLAVPQGNPTNLVVIEQLGLSPEAFVARLFVPALLATLICVSALALVERGSLRGRYEESGPPGGPLSPGERAAAAALAAAALAGGAAPWLGVAPWWAISGVATLVFAGARALRRAVPTLPVPGRVAVQIAALVVVFSPLSGVLHSSWTPVTLASLVAFSLAVGAAASLANNLPMSVVIAGSVLGLRGPSAYSALAGLSVGALATPHGSIATLIAFDRAGRRAEELGASSYLKLWVPTAVLATAAATICLWLIAGGP